MSNLTHLVEVMVAEAELTEELVGVMKRQQHALVNLDATTVADTIEKQQELLLPIEGLENERVRLTKEIWNTVAPSTANAVAVVDLSTLLMKLGDEQTKQVSDAGSRLRTAVETMIKLNQANQYLIEHSRRFVRETFRIVTNGYSRKMIDQKI